MSETADTVPAGERRFKLMDMPCDQDWACKLDADILEKLPAAARSEWVARDRIAQKLDFLIRNAVDSNNALFYLEEEVLKGKKFRQAVMARVTMLSLVLGVLISIFGRAIGDRILSPKQPIQNYERRDTKSP